MKKAACSDDRTLDTVQIRCQNHTTLEYGGRNGDPQKNTENLIHKITHEYYVGGYGGHDWSTWRHLLYYRFLPNLWRKN